MTAEEFIRSIPSRIDREIVENKKSSFYFDLSGEGGGQLCLILNNGEVEVLEGPQEYHNCEVRADAGDFMRVVRGELNPMMALLTGRLKVKNQKELLEYAKIFGLSR